MSFARKKDNIKVGKMRSIHNKNFEYNQLNITEKLIVDYIDRNAQDIISMSITELAMQLHVNKASIVSVCKKIGFTGYKEMKDYVENSRANFDYPNQNKIQRILSNASNFNHSEVVDLFTGVNKIICIARGNSYNVAEIFANIASYNKYHVLNSNSIGRIDSEIYKYEDNRLIVVFSHSANTQSILKTCQIAKNRGIKILLITGNPHGKVNEYCDIVINYDTYSQSSDKYDLSTRVEMLIVINELLEVILNEKH